MQTGQEANKFKLHLQERTGQLYDAVLSSSIVDWKTELLTFLIYAPTGQLAGTICYDWKKDKSSNRNDGRYVNHINQLSVPYTFNKLKTPLAIVTEGIFDAIRVISAGYSAYPLLSNNNTPVLTTISLMAHSEICYLMDADCKGIVGLRRNLNLIDSYAICDANLDPNSTSLERIEELIDQRVSVTQLKRNFNENDLRRNFTR